ncbi:MAG: hypothetical protein WAP52_04290 [Candidatus Sungiibacteriota bacterium]
MRILLGVAAICFYIFVGVQADAQSAHTAGGWQICTRVTEFPIPIAKTGIVLQGTAGRLACLPMDMHFRHQLHIAGLPDAHHASPEQVAEWLEANTTLPHEHMLMPEIKKGSKVINLDFCR